MANMSYCRMENTAQDLQDVYENWEDADSESELRYREKILKLCHRIINAFDEEGEYIKNEETNLITNPLKEKLSRLKTIFELAPDMYVRELEIINQ